MMTVPELVRRFGGEKAVATRFGLTAKAVEMWERRGFVPGCWHIPLLLWAKEIGVPLSMSDLVTTSPMDGPLNEFREARGMTPSDLARLLGVTRATAHRWLTGDRKIGRQMLSAVSQKTGIPARELRPDLAELLEGAQ